MVCIHLLESSKTSHRAEPKKGKESEPNQHAGIQEPQAQSKLLEEDDRYHCNVRARGYAEHRLLPRQWFTGDVRKQRLKPMRKSSHQLSRAFATLVALRSSCHPRNHPFSRAN